MQPQNPSQHSCPGSYNQLIDSDTQVETYFPSEPGTPKEKGKCATLEIMTRNKNRSHSLSVYLVPAILVLSICMH